MSAYGQIPQPSAEQASATGDMVQRGVAANLEAAIDAGEPALFADYVGWATVLMGGHGIPPRDQAGRLQLTAGAAYEALDDPARAVLDEYRRAGLACLSAGPTDLPSHLVSEAPHAALARAWLDALLDGERHRASRMILDAVSAGAQVAAIYQHVFQPALYEIGRLWQMNAISVAQEHYCTAATQLVMSQLYPQVFASEKGTGTLVATCVAGDLHEIGLRMVADVFELDGWNTYYLGANMPPQDVVDMVVRRRADVLAISATMTTHLRHVRELIQLVRAHPGCHDVCILVGGHPFHVAPDLWRGIGADGSVPTAQEATVLARRLVADGR